MCITSLGPGNDLLDWVLVGHSGLRWTGSSTHQRRNEMTGFLILLVIAVVLYLLLRWIQVSR